LHDPCAQLSVRPQQAVDPAGDLVGAFRAVQEGEAFAQALRWIECAGNRRFGVFAGLGHLVLTICKDCTIGAPRCR
jgi:hypothetical protein